MRGLYAVGFRGQGWGGECWSSSTAGRRFTPRSRTRSLIQGLYALGPGPQPLLFPSRGLGCGAPCRESGLPHKHMMVVAKGVKIVLKRLLCGPRAGLAFVLGKKARFLLRSNSGRKKTHTHTTLMTYFCVCVCVFMCLFISIYVFYFIWIFSISRKL